MEQFPNNNPENTNQEPTDTDILANMPSYEEMRRQNAVPEGIRDVQDYLEYIAEKTARKSEETRSNQEVIKHDEALLTEVLHIKNPKDKYIATAFLPSLFDRNGKSKAKDDDKRFGLEIIIDYSKREDENISIGEYIKSMEPNSRYDVNTIGLIELLDDYSDIQLKNDDQNSNLPIMEYCKDNNIRNYDYYGKKLFSNYSDTIDNENSAFSLGEKDFVERSKQDKGVILAMAERRIQQLKNEKLNDEEHALAETELYLIGRFYAGEGFGNQFRNNNYFMDMMEGAIHEGAKTVPIRKGVLHFYAIHNVAEEFSDEKSGYGYFLDRLTKGQEIIENFTKQHEVQQ